MKDFSSRSATVPRSSTEVPSYLSARRHQGGQGLDLWYRIASPPEPGEAASFKEMERFRRGRTGSQIILGLYFVLIVALLSGLSRLAGTNIYLVPIVIGATASLILATLLNRLSRVTAAGIIVVLTFVTVPFLDISTTPGGMGMLSLPLFGLLVLPLLCAVSFLPPWWVFVVALANILFTLYSLMYLPRTAELDAVLAIAFAGILTPIILSQIIIAIVAYVWVQGTTQALSRADRAEEIARLEHDLAHQAEEAARQKQRLEASIQKIVEVHTRVANGDFSARVPLTEDNVLWQISGALNNLLTRVQRLRHDAVELQRVKFALQQAREENRQLTRKLGDTLY
jgi:hypothetical protein